MEPQKKSEKDQHSHITVEPFNDVTEHYQKIMGMPNQRADISTFPKWLRIFYSIIATFVTVCVLFMVGIKIFQWMKG